MKFHPLLLALTIAFITSCSDSSPLSSFTDSQHKDSVFHIILVDINLSEEMTDSLISRYPEMVKGRLNYGNTIAAGDIIADEIVDNTIITEPAQVQTPVIKTVAPKTTAKAKPEPIKVKEPEPKVVAKAAETYKFNSGQMKLDGTSSLHDWDLIATSFTASASILMDDSDNLKSIESLKLTLPVKNLTNKDNKLTNNAWDALKADQHNNINYVVSKATIVPQQGNIYLVKTSGNLTIAGVTKAINLDATCRINSNNTITMTGSTVINMTDYNVKPPTFMLGAMKTGEKVKLNYNVEFNR